MSPLNHLGAKVIVPAVVATMLGMVLGTASATGVSRPALAQDDVISTQVAYNSKRWPVSRNVHRSTNREKAEFARFEEKTEADTAVSEKKRKTHGYHRRAPYGPRTQP